MVRRRMKYIPLLWSFTEGCIARVMDEGDSIDAIDKRSSPHPLTSVLLHRDGRPVFVMTDSEDGRRLDRKSYYHNALSLYEYEEDLQEPPVHLRHLPGLREVHAPQLPLRGVPEA